MAPAKRGRGAGTERAALLELEHYKALVEATSDWAWEVDARGAYTYVSPKVTELLGYRPQELLGKTPFALMPEEEAKRVGELFQRAIAARGAIDGVVNANRHRDGHLVYLETSAVPILRGGELTGYRGIDRDVSARVQAERRLQLSDAVMRSAAEGIIIAGPDGKVLAANPAFLSLTGFLEEQVLGQPPTMLWSAVDAQRGSSLWATLGTAERWSGEGLARGRAGEIFPVWLTLSAAHRDGQRSGFVALVSDVTERRAAEETIRFQATHDALTGLANRAWFISAVRKALERAREEGAEVAVLFVDLDGFKPVNDLHGHAVGDLLLAAVARRLEGCARRGDVVARFGGDEFILFIAAPKALEIARRVGATIAKRLGEPFTLDGRPVQIGASVGLTVFPRDGDTVDELVLAADQAMYEAKLAGGGRVALHGEVGKHPRVSPPRPHPSAPPPPKG